MTSAYFWAKRGAMEWLASTAPVPYPDALAFMEARVAAIRAGAAEECVWLLEHPPLYTAGTGAREGDLLQAQFPVFEAGRGGQYTYHGPGQRVAYVMLDLKRLFAPAEPDLRRYIQMLEQWIIATLAEFGVEGFTREGRVGVWIEANQSHLRQPSTVSRRSSESKIAAIGVRVRRWVAYHGIAINVMPDLSHYAGIVPCGIREHGVTSLHALGIGATLAEVDATLQRQFTRCFDPLASLSR